MQELYKFHNSQGINDTLLDKRSIVCVSEVFTEKKISGYVVLDSRFNLHGVIVIKLNPPRKTGGIFLLAFESYFHSFARKVKTDDRLPKTRS